MVKVKKRISKKKTEGIKFGGEISEKDMIIINDLTTQEMGPYKTLLPSADENSDREAQLTKIKLIAAGRTLNWYRTNSTLAQQKKWVLEYLRNKGEDFKANLLKGLDEVWFQTIGSACRLRTCCIDVYPVDYEDRKMASLVSRASVDFFDKTGKMPTEKSLEAVIEEKKTTRKKVDVQAATKAMVNKYIKMFEDELYKQINRDEWKPKVFKKMFNDLGVKKRPMKKIRAYFAELDDDMVSVIDEYLEDL